MKKLLLALLLLCGLYSNAQIFQPGDKWVYSGYNPFPEAYYITNYVYLGDTIVESVQCQNVSGILFRSDSTKIQYKGWNSIDFVTIFDYSLQVGDSLFIPTADCNIDLGYYVHISDKGVDTISGTLFRWLNYTSDYFNGWPIFIGKYYERIGMLSGSLIPQSDCVFDAPGIGCLHAFINSSDTILNNLPNCPIITGIAEIPTELFSLYPNPITNGALTIQSQNTVKRIELIDMLGQSVFSAALISNTINIGNVAQGIYVAKVTFADGKVGYKKVIILN